MNKEQLDKMTPEEKRIKIAELCGFRRIHRDPQVYDPSGRLLFGVDKDGYEMDVPDYLHSLDGIHEAESIMTDEQHRLFRKILFSGLYNKGEDGQTDDTTERAVMSATADQRSTAFLLTMLTHDPRRHQQMDGHLRPGV